MRSDSMIMIKILMTLSTCYGHFITAWESTNIEQRNLGNLIGRLLAEETRVRDNKQTENEALATVKRQNDNKVKKKGYRKDKQEGRLGMCHYCKEKGH